MKFAYRAIIYCDRIYPTLRSLVPLPLISSFCSINPFPTLHPSFFDDPVCLHGVAFIGALVRSYMEKHEQLANSYTTEENVSSSMSALLTGFPAASEAW